MLCNNYFLIVMIFSIQQVDKCCFCHVRSVILNCDEHKHTHTHTNTHSHPHEFSAKRWGKIEKRLTIHQSP